MTANRPTIPKSTSAFFAERFRTPQILRVTGDAAGSVQFDGGQGVDLHLKIDFPALGFTFLSGDEASEPLIIPGPRGPAGPQGLSGIPGFDGESGEDGLILPPSAFPVRAGASSTTTVAAPTAANSTANFTMQGLAGAITPRTTGNILVSIAGTVTATTTTVNNGVILQGSYGTGTAPTSNAALTGTQAGALQEFTWPTAATAAADVHYGFNIVFLLPSVILGTTYWLDLAAKAVTTVSEAPLVNVVITATEV